MAPVKSLHVGVFLPSPAGTKLGTQLLDTACVDILGMLDRAYVEILAGLLPSPPPGDAAAAGADAAAPAALVDLAPSVRISYVGAAPAGTLVPLTAGLRLPLTHHYADDEVRPGRLDVVVVPGPDPRGAWEDGALAWLRAHHAGEGAGAAADVLSVCTGVYVCGAAGLLDKPGRRACGPRGVQADLRARFGAVEWVGEERRWVRDGNFWSSGGITNGNDLVAAYCRESGRFDPRLVEVVLAMADVGDRPALYGDKSHQG